MMKLLFYSKTVYFSDSKVPKKHRRFGTKIYQFCDSKEYTYSIIMYLGKNRECVGPSMTSSHATYWNVLKMWEKNYIWTLFLSPSFDNLHAKTINCCGNDRQDKKKFQIIWDRK